MNIKITDENIYEQSNQIIKKLYGQDANFRDGQYEAIEATMTRKRVLVVQRTGWGKSLVYFVCTKLMRQIGKGVTVVVSPLLILMENQIEAATKLGLCCDVLNSNTQERKSEILNNLENNALDLVLITPETLFSDEVQTRLKNINIGLFVIDEAHCISDWGHDFRLEYGQLKKVISTLPQTVPILATTATANNRVVKDLENQLGSNVYVSRGPLTRESLSIQVLKMATKIERYAWILENINKLFGSGIIYCLTQRDCEQLSDFLKNNGISAEAYYSRGSKEGELLNKEIEKQFQNNEIKAIVATIKLGMGYDKDDIAFVIHFQMPSNIVSYYQQIGRAGRNIERAYTFLMFGQEDEDIINYFISTAFPTEMEVSSIMNYVSDNNGVKKQQISSALNIRQTRLEKAISFLLHDGFLMKDKSTYYATPKPFVYDKTRYDSITAIRIAEVEQLKELAYTSTCYSKFVVKCLDDENAYECGHCANCIGKDIFPSSPSLEMVHKAEEYINGLIIDIEPRRKWPLSDCTKNSFISSPNKVGICIAKYGDPGYGGLVKRDKYGPQKQFCDELLEKSVEILRPFIEEKGINYITCVPSIRSGIVFDFSKRLADALGIEFVELLKKNNNTQQKDMLNSSYQCSNAMRSYSLLESVQVPDKILLVDDVVDSKWTLTVCGYCLSNGGCKEVYPFALADSSQREC